MKVFVSWSGSLSQGVAAILHKYLPCIIQNLEVFVSKHDIESGIRWASRLAEELEETDFGILCLGSESVHSEWLLFEAGALTKKMEGRACGLLIGGLKPADVSGPLAQFQNRVLERDGVRALLVDINAALKAPRKSEQLDMLFEKFWPDIEAGYKEALKSSDSGTTTQPERSDRDLLEEVLTIVRNTPRRTESANPSKLVARSPTLKVSSNAHQHLSRDDFSFLDSLVGLENRGLSEAAQQSARENPNKTQRLIAAGCLHMDAAGQITFVDGDQT